MADGGHSTTELARARRRGALACILNYLGEGGDVDKLQGEVLRGLTDGERAAILALMIGTFHRDVAEGMCRNWFANQGAPAAPFNDDPMPEAELWAACASEREIRAYGKAVVEAMSPKLRERFIKWAGNRGDG